MSHHPSYQLTRHPIGSLREIWAISWPLMIGLLSSSLMMFADRLLLSHYSTQALTASATAGMASYVLIIIPMIIAGISEVFVGRNHGANQLKEVGKPAWQMVWLSLLSTPFFWLSAFIVPKWLFLGTENGILETEYFQWIIYFAPAFCSTIALSGFFIGIGHVKVVTYAAVLGNVTNIGLDILFIFGFGSLIPSMGIKGAALATGLSQLFQTLFLLALFLRKSNRETYGTDQWRFDRTSFLEGIYIGGPAGIGKFLELLAHFVFLRIVQTSGSDNMTILTVVQSFYILMAFIVEGLSKGVSSIAANLIGGRQETLIKKVLNSALTLQFAFFCIVFIGMLGFSHPLLTLFFSEQEVGLLNDPHFYQIARSALLWMSLFFLLDGFSWVYAGFLTACGDTKFLLYASLVLNWVFYILPSYFLLGIGKGSAAQGWMLVAFYALLTCLTYRWRYQSSRWKSNFADTISLEEAKRLT